MGDLAVWQVLIAGRYRLVDQVGSGGMGRVWLARDEMLHRDVAIKEILPPDWLTGPERGELGLTTLREARTAARLNHANVVRIYDVVSTGDGQWIVMEYVQSRSLHEVLEADGPLSPQRTAHLGLAVLAALRAAHRAGVLHRDVKPHNVLIADDGRVVLTDFGLATFDGGDGATTRPGMVLGSAQYVAPERAADGVSSVQTDLWSLGATLYAAVEGRSPYGRSTAMATLTALATAPPDPMLRAGPLRPVLAGLLHRDPRQRLTADEVDRQLRRISEPRIPRPRLPLGRTGRIPIAPVTGPLRETHPLATGGLPAPRPDQQRTRTIRRAATASGVLVLVALLAALGTAMASTAGRGPSEPGAALTGSPTPTAAPTRPAPFACVAPPAPGAATRITPAPPLPGERYALVDHWTWYVDPSGFRIAAPVGWLLFVDAGVTCLREPGGARVLSVDPAAPRTAGAAEAVVHWRQEAARLVDRGALPGFQNIGITPIDLQQGGAEWECRWTTATSDTLHISRLLLNTAGRRAYTVSWLTRDFDWQINRAYLGMIRQSFRPAGQ